MTTERIVIVGGPRRGKSTLAEALSLAAGQRGDCLIYCGDPLSKVKEPRAGVVYLPEGIPISGDDGAAQWVADNWFTLPGPWVCEGWVMARALRRWRDHQLSVFDFWNQCSMPCDRIIVLDRPGFGRPSKAQNAMHKAVMTVWNEIAREFEPIVEYL